MFHPIVQNLFTVIKNKKKAKTDFSFDYSVQSFSDSKMTLQGRIFEW